MIQWKKINFKDLIDLLISYTIILLFFGRPLFFTKEYLEADLLAQGLPFLAYFKDYFHIFRDWQYNWTIALGDTNIAVLGYYLLSPFNLVLKLFPNINMVTLLPYFLVFKIGMMPYFASKYFCKILGPAAKLINQ